MGRNEFRKYLATLGAKGGKAAASRLTPEQRIERARKGGKARAEKQRGEAKHEKTARDR